MKKYTIILAVLITALFLSKNVLAKERTIILEDGTTLKGEIVGIKGGRYVIRTSSLGEVKIRESDIQTITTKENIQKPANTNSMGTFPNGSILNNPKMQGQINQMQNMILNNESLMNDVSGLLNNEEIMSVLSNPNLINQLKTSNMTDIENNPGMKKLMNNPQMKEFIEKIQGQSQPTQ